MTCAVIVPVLRRPHRVRPLIDSLTASGADAWPLFVCSSTDTAEQEAVKAAGAEMLVVDGPLPVGDYAHKINTAVDATSDDTVFLGADDLAFHAGWLKAAMSQLTGTVGVVGTNDLGNKRVMRGQHATHCLVARWYTKLGTVDDPTRLLHEGYVHEYVDDEFVGTARKRGAFAFAAHSIVEHLHPNWGKSPMDELYAAQKQRMAASLPLFRERRRLWM